MILFIHTLEGKLAKEDREKELAKTTTKQARTVVIILKAKASQKVQAEQAITAAKMEVITQQHQHTTNRVQRDNEAVHSLSSVWHEEGIHNVSTFVARKKQQTIDSLRNTVREKMGVLAELQSEMKTTFCTTATEKHAIQDEH